MSGGPGYRLNAIEMTVAEAREFFRAAAAAVDARLHGGQSSEPRQEMIRQEIVKEFDKRASYP